MPHPPTPSGNGSSNDSGSERVYDPFAPKFPVLTIITPDPPRRSTAERYGALFYMGIGGLVVMLALLTWFGWSAWNLRTVWRNVYVLHDESRPEAERMQAAYDLGHDPNVNQRQLWDLSLRKPLPDLARYMIAESLTAEAATADPRAYGIAVSKSEGWPDWLRLLLVRPITYASALGFPIETPSLIELSKNPDRFIALWAETALAIGPDHDPAHGAILRKAAATESPEQGLAVILVKALDATRESERITALNEATLWLRDHYPEALKVWKGWKAQGGRVVPNIISGLGIASFFEPWQRGVFLSIRTGLFTLHRQGNESMRNLLDARLATLLTLGTALSLGTISHAIAQDSKKVTSPEKSSPRRAEDKQRTSGVIVKAEKMTGTADAGSTIADEIKEHPERRTKFRLTINTDAVWRDWVRDQTQVTDGGSTAKDVAKGKNSVATKGEPLEQNSKVIVDIVAATKVETRFRAPDDETSKGEKKPEGATRAEAAKAVEFQASDLKPGLFIEVDFKHVTAQNLAEIITVIRPVTASKK